MSPQFRRIYFSFHDYSNFCSVRHSKPTPFFQQIEQKPFMATVFFMQLRIESQKKNGLAPTATPILCSCHSAGSHYFAQGSDIRASCAESWRFRFGPADYVRMIDLWGKFSLHVQEEGTTLFSALFTFNL